jgi:hypothetical protein
MRFYYYYPTWNKPSGGNKQIRLMGSLLSELGVEACLLRDRKFFAADPPFDDNVFYGVPVPVAPFPFEDAGAHLRPEDVVVLPEVLLDRTLPQCRGWRCRLALNNQNGFYGLRYRPPLRETRRAIEFAVANAPYVASLCRNYLAIPAERIFLIPLWVTRPPFELRTDGLPRALSVCYMPRKIPDEARRVRELVRATHPDVPWVEIDGLTEPEVAQKYRESSIFFAAQDLEGFGLPAAEAMACGCLVAGFAGTGRFPHPYATTANGFWAPDRDVTAAAEMVRRAIDIVCGGRERYDQYLDAGRQTARRFTKVPVLDALADLMRVVERRGYGARKNTVAGLGWGGELFAHRLLYNYDQLGWAGRLLSSVSKTTKPLRKFLGAATS